MVITVFAVGGKYSTLSVQVALCSPPTPRLTYYTLSMPLEIVFLSGCILMALVIVWLRKVRFWAHCRLRQIVVQIRRTHTNTHTHTRARTHTHARTGKDLSKNTKKICTGSPLEGSTPASNFSMTQTLHISVYSKTRPHQSCVDCMHRRPLQSFECSNISCRRNLLF